MTATLEPVATPGATDHPDSRSRLVVIGNGMAGARAVEEILARGGAEKFAVTIFGEEPYGNYNRIMLSHVLAGEQTDDDIYLNALDWYEEHGVTLMCAAPADHTHLPPRIPQEQSWPQAQSPNSRRPSSGGTGPTGSTSR